MKYVSKKEYKKRGTVRRVHRIHEHYIIFHPSLFSNERSFINNCVKLKERYKTLYLFYVFYVILREKGKVYLYDMRTFF